MSRSHISESMRVLARRRANATCEYCLYPDAICYAAFHCDHCVSQRHGGRTSPGNLAWACPTCNSSKGSDIAAVDPRTGVRTPLFHPRRDLWADHFKWSKELDRIIGITPTGRATVRKLDMNRPQAIEIRSQMLRLGCHPALDGSR